MNIFFIIYRPSNIYRVGQTGLFFKVCNFRTTICDTSNSSIFREEQDCYKN